MMMMTAAIAQASTIPQTSSSSNDWQLSSNNPHHNLFKNINNNLKSSTPSSNQNQLSSSFQSKPRGKLWDEALKEPIKFSKGKTISTTKDIPFIPINRRSSSSNLAPEKSKNQSSSKLRSNEVTGSIGSSIGGKSTTKNDERLKRTQQPDSAKSLNQPEQSSSKLPTNTRANQAAVITSWSRPQKIGPGFINTGNTCFLNATLQVLVHTPAINIGLMDMDEHSPKSCQLAKMSKFCALCKMYSLLQICFKQASSSHCVRPSPISQSLTKFAPRMRVGHQEDAHEFFMLLLDAMEFSPVGGREEKSRQKSSESTFIKRVFGGKFRTRLICEHCKTPSDTFEYFNNLGLDVTQSNSVNAALKRFHKIERMYGSNQYKCDKCKRLRDATRVDSISSPPAILTLHLKKFNARGNKINKRIHFEESLDLRPAMGDESKPARYNLYAVVSHQGHSSRSGHYYSHIKASNGKWYLADDSTIQAMSSSRQVLVNQNAYILFYARDRADFLKSAIEENSNRCRNSEQLASNLNMITSHKRKATEDLENPQNLSSSLLTLEDNPESIRDQRSNSKRQRNDKDQRNQVNGKRPFIGPVLPENPSKTIQPSSSSSNPKANCNKNPGLGGLSDREFEELSELVERADKFNLRSEPESTGKNLKSLKTVNRNSNSSSSASNSRSSSSSTTGTSSNPSKSNENKKSSSSSSKVERTRIQDRKGGESDKRSDENENEIEEIEMNTMKKKKKKKKRSKHGIEEIDLSRTNDNDNNDDDHDKSKGEDRVDDDKDRSDSGSKKISRADESSTDYSKSKNLNNRLRTSSSPKVIRINSDDEFKKDRTENQSIRFNDSLLEEEEERKELILSEERKKRNKRKRNNHNHNSSYHNHKIKESFMMRRSEDQIERRSGSISNNNKVREKRLSNGGSNGNSRFMFESNGSSNKFNGNNHGKMPMIIRA